MKNILEVGTEKCEKVNICKTFVNIDNNLDGKLDLSEDFSGGFLLFYFFMFHECIKCFLSKSQMSPRFHNTLVIFRYISFIMLVDASSVMLSGGFVCLTLTLVTGADPTSSCVQ